MNVDKTLADLHSMLSGNPTRRRSETDVGQGGNKNEESARRKCTFQGATTGSGGKETPAREESVRRREAQEVKRKKPQNWQKNCWKPTQKVIENKMDLTQGQPTLLQQLADLDLDSEQSIEASECDGEARQSGEAARNDFLTKFQDAIRRIQTAI